MSAAAPISDTYTGDFSESEVPQRKSTPKATIVKLSVGPMDNNVYVITDKSTGKALLIDAANDADTLIELIKAHGNIELIFTTHWHPDHWIALEEVVKATGLPTAAGRIDAEPIQVQTDRLIDEGDVIEVGDLRLEAIHLKGHTDGSIALFFDDDITHLFTGDSLFPGGVGKTQTPEDFDSLIDDVKTKLFDRFDDSAVVYPGHGLDTTIGAERPHLEEWRERRW
ncbi:MBL fold metallo-hydrolase [Williamsia sp. 1138]|uniref:MBL fold metallo-hydrolase n=1 Tax=Williamsia sp. 1138 TaxID=1903117 RepID=UPI000A0FFF9C|nr:MBL fold metallo-hydrolase [Williamsia sp. 1138]OZG29501.1 MBL fold metallo-hydrolase [Williamsia sp. 1138]